MQARMMVPYLGPLPDWMPYWLRSAACNPELEFWIFNDQPPPIESWPANVRWVFLSKQALLERVSALTGGLFVPEQFPVYKLCDLRPLFGELFAREIGDSPYWGFCDLDLVFGRCELIWKGQPAEDIYATNGKRLSGHFSLFRNQPEINRSWRLMARYPEWLLHAENLGLDESEWSGLFLPISARQKWNRLRRRTSLGRLAVCSRYWPVTPHCRLPWADGSADYPWKYEWIDGRIHPEGGGPELPYLHFMNWKSARWRPACYEPWPVRDFRIEPLPADARAFRLSPEGLAPRFEQSF